MNTVFLHIGLGKTATTFIQTQLAHMSVMKKIIGVEYPIPKNWKVDYDCNYHGNGHDTAIALRQAKTIDEQIDVLDLHLLPLLRLRARTDLLISSEDFGVLEKGKVEVLSNYINNKGYKLTIIVTVRQLIRFAYSFYMQMVASNGESRVLEKLKAYEYMSQPLTVLNNWGFLKKNIRFVDTQKADILKSFFKEIPKSSFESVDTHVVNRSISNGEYEALLKINSYFGNDKEICRFISHQLKTKRPYQKSKKPSKVEIKKMQHDLESIKKNYIKSYERLGVSYPDFFLDDSDIVGHDHSDSDFLDDMLITLDIFAELCSQNILFFQKVVENKNKLINHKDHLLNQKNIGA